MENLGTNKPNTNKPGVRPSSLRSDGAQARFGQAVVAEYVRSGGTASREERAILGANAKRLLDRGASDSDILAAVREFAQTRRWPRYVAEWTTERELGQEISVHRKRMEADRMTALKSMREIFAQIGELRGS